jgi:hypothetical protein
LVGLQAYSTTFRYEPFHRQTDEDILGKSLQLLRTHYPEYGLMYIFNGPIGYDELTGTIYINPESVDGFVVAQTEPGLSEDEAREAIGRVLSQICG